ncbi:MAG: hypothetical protein AAB407_02690 [Patescibacteria group bacterium]
MPIKKSFSFLHIFPRPVEFVMVFALGTLVGVHLAPFFKSPKPTTELKNAEKGFWVAAPCPDSPDWREDFETHRLEKHSILYLDDSLDHAPHPGEKSCFPRLLYVTRTLHQDKPEDNAEWVKLGDNFFIQDL